jgi:hypothetical protein
MQISRLNDALLISYSAMSPDNPEAVDRYVRIVRELDRYHGFAVPQPPAHSCPLRLAGPNASLLLEAPDTAQDEENAASGFNTQYLSCLGRCVTAPGEASAGNGVASN